MTEAPARLRLWLALVLAVLNPVVACLYCGRNRWAAWVLAAMVVSTAALWLGPVDLPALYLTLAVGLLPALGPSLGLLIWLVWRVRRDPWATPGPWRRWPVLLGLFVAMLLVNPSLWWDSPIGHFTIPSGSMEPTLQVGDRAVSENPDRPGARAVEPGDVIFFSLPRDPDQHWVKRLVALGGEMVQMRGGVLHLNGVPVARRPLPGPPPASVLPGATAWEETLPNGRSHVVLEPASMDYALADTPPFQVPAGHGFVLGDNRANSMDSRVPSAIGFVPLGYVIGRGVMRYHLGTGWTVGPIH